MNDNDWVDRLKRDAAHDTPAFSKDLHDRVMRSLRDLDRHDATMRRSSHRLMIWGALAAAAIVLLALGLWHGATEPSQLPAPQIVQRPSPPQLPEPAEIVRRTVDPARDRLEDARFAYLDRDARRLADFLVRQIPETPAAP